MKEVQQALEETERSIGERKRYIEYLKHQIDGGQLKEPVEHTRERVATSRAEADSDHDSLGSFFDSSSWEDDEGSYV